MNIYWLYKRFFIRKNVTVSPRERHEQYISHIYKDIKKIDNKYLKEYKGINKLEVAKKNNEFIDYLYAKKKLDSVKDKGINYFENKKSVKDKSSYLNLRDNQNKLVKLFNISNENKLNIKKRYIKENIIEEHSKDIKSRKVSNNLVEPYYFFTARYNEKSMPSQIKHWTSSAYNFFRPDKTVNNHLDLFTSKLINLFFRVKYLRRKFIWDTKLLEGFKINTNKQLIEDIKVLDDHTGIESTLASSETNTYPRILLSYNWLIEQIKSSESLRSMIKRRKLEFFVGLYAKRKSYLRKLGRVLLSKPLFKHTSFNIIIDLFIYNNKRYKYRMLKNILVRRGIYKYMYSMYVDYYNKISETLNRPRFFYINLIEPNTYYYYNWVLKNIRKMYKYKLYHYLRYTFLLISKKFLITTFYNNSDLDNNNKTEIFSNFYIRNNNNPNTYDKLITEDSNNIINQSNKEISSFKRYSKNLKYNVRYNQLNKLIFKLKEKSYLKLYNINKNTVEKVKIESEGDENIKDKKTVKDVNLKFLMYKKYLEELDRKSSKPVDLNTLSLWNTDGLGKNFRTPLGINNNLSNYTNKHRFTYGAYKRNKYKDDYNNKFMSYGKLKKRGVWNKRNKKFNNIPLNELINSYDNLKKNNEKKIFNNNNKFSDNYSAIKVSPIFVPWTKSSDLTRENSNLSEIDNNLIIKEDNIIKNNLEQDNLNKEDFIKEVYYNDSDVVKGLFTSFYFNDYNDNNDKNLNNKNVIYFENKDKQALFNSKIAKYLSKKKNDINLNLGINRLNKYNKNVINRKSRSFIKNIDLLRDRKIINSKKLWDRLDTSIINVLYSFTVEKSIYDQVNKNKDRMIFNNKSVDLLNKFYDFGDIWYIIHQTNLLKKEFYKINREVLLSKNRDIIPLTSYKVNDSFYSNENERSSNVKYYENVVNNFSGYFWPAFYTNKREDNMRFRINFSEKIFKPYYRYMLPLFIQKKYFELVLKIPYWTPDYLFKNLNILRNQFVIYNYVSVRLVLDLLRYNYRYLIKVKPKYHFLNKLRYFQTRLKKVNINSWVASIRYISRLRKIPNNFWLRFFKVVSYYYSLIIKNAEIDTDRKIFVPFVIYFEDILFNIYGKWALVRLWPLKNYYLSSYILAGRVLTLIVWRRRHKLSKFNFQRITTKLITGIRILQIQKAYDYYIKNYSNWPSNLIKKLSDTDKSKSVRYSKLEFNETKIFRLHTLNSYNLFINNSLNFYLPAVRNNYLNDFYININSIKRKFRSSKIRNLSINRLQLIYFWLRPLKNYIYKLNRNIDISGIKIRITGRAGIRRNNLRSLYKTKFYGNLMGPLHFVAKLKKPKTISLPRLRGYLRSNIDYALSVSKTKNGSISFKVWISSVLSTDVHELLLHLVRIKTLYSQLVNRYFVVKHIVRKVNNDYLFFPIKDKLTKRYRYINKWKKIK
jgi:hypothetical protein